MKRSWSVNPKTVGIVVTVVATLPILSCSAVSLRSQVEVPAPVLFATVSGSDAEGNEQVAAPVFGASVVAGDVDGDGLDDLVIAATGSGIFPRARAGDVYVLLGPIVSIDLEETDAALTLRGRTPFRGAGSRIALADLNGDGHPDVAIAALWTSRREHSSHSFDPEGGAVYVVDSSLRGEHDLETAAFLTITGPPSLGRSLAAGDYDGDGVDDLIIACPLRAEVYVVRGPRSGVLRMPDDADVIISGDSGSLGLDLSVADVDADGRVELAVSDRARNLVYIVPGGLSGRLSVEAVATATIRSADAQDRFRTVLLADLTGDGELDLIVTARRADSENLGTVFVLPGPLEGEIDARANSTLLLDDVDQGTSRVVVAVSAPREGEPPLLALGMPGRNLFPNSNQFGEVWLLSGELVGRHMLGSENIGLLGRRLPATDTDLTLFGFDVLFAETHSADRPQLVVSALFGRVRVPDFGAVLVYDLGEGE